MWAAQQIVEACPLGTLPKYLLRDRDGIYSGYFQSRIQNMGINEVITAPKIPWQNPYVERMIGSIRSDCINAMIILNEAHLRHILTEYFAYYHEDRTHPGLGKEPPAGRLVSKKQGNAKVIALPHWAVFTIGMNGRMLPDRSAGGEKKYLGFPWLAGGCAMRVSRWDVCMIYLFFCPGVFWTLIRQGLPEVNNPHSLFLLSTASQATG